MKIFGKLAKFIVGQRGCNVLLVDGYHYNRNRSAGEKTYWICSRKVYKHPTSDEIVFYLNHIRIDQRIILFFSTFIFQGSVKCRARVITQKIKGIEEIVHQSFEHNHVDAKRWRK